MDLHEVKLRLQSHLSDGLVVVVGSGLSCAEGLPGMTELTDHLLKQVGPKLDAADVVVWEEIKALLATEGLESTLLKRPPTPALESAISAATASLVGECERAVTKEVFDGTKTLRFTRLVQHLIKPSNGLPIVTTNYDRLLEIAVEEAGIGADTMFCGRFAGELNERESRLGFCRNVTIRKRNVVYDYRPRASIYKPHGSLDWYLRNGRPVSYEGDLPGLTRLIITPGHNKFRNGYESPFDLHRSRANEAIDSANRFLIVGYGFNDDHLETHLSPSIRNGKPTLMLTYELSANAEALAIGHSNVIALDHAQESGIKGTRLIINKTKIFLPDLSIWDVNSFITDILEP